MIKKYLITALLFVAAWQGALTTQAQTLDDAWKAFVGNRFKDARSAFNRNLSNPDAYLGLVMTDKMLNEPEEAFDHFMSYFNASPNPYPAMIALWESDAVLGTNGGVLKPKRLAFVEELLKKPDLDGRIRAMANQALLEHYQSKGDFKKMAKYQPLVGFVTQWSVLGEFENISGSGFNKEYPVFQLNKKKKIENKWGYPVDWFNGITRNSGWLDFEYLFMANSTVVFAQTFVTSPTKQKVQLRFGTSGSYKVWVNDSLAGVDEEERNNDIDTYIIEVTLSQGCNRILFQIGNSEISSLNMLLRITDEKGENISGLTFDAKPGNYPTNAKIDAKNIKLSNEDFLEKSLAKNPNQLSAYVLLIETYLRNDKTLEARRLIKTALTKWPTCIYLMQQKANAFSRDRNNSGLSSTIREIKDIDSTTYYSLNITFSEAIDQENYDLAASLLDLIKEKYGEDDETIDKDLTLMSKRNEEEKLVKYILKAYKEHPENRTLVYLRYLVEKSRNKNNSAAIGILKKYLKKKNDSEFWKEIANVYAEMGQVNMMIGIYNKLVQNYPYAIGYKITLANIYRQLRNFSEAKKYVKAALDQAPYISNYMESLAEIYESESVENKNAESDAIKYYETAIAMSPTNYDAREKLRTMKSQSSIWTYFDKPDYMKIFKNSPSKDDYPEDNSLVLLYEDQRVVYPGGGSENMEYVMVKVFNSEGVDSWKEYNVGGNRFQYVNINDAYIIKANGSKVDADRNGSQLVFTNLEPGDAIVVSFKSQDYYSGKLGQHFWDKHTFTLGIPILKSAYSLLIDSDKKLDWKMTNSTYEPTTSTIGEFTKYKWVQENIPAFKREKLSPDASDKGVTLHLSTFPDWDYVSKWYEDLSISKAKPDIEVKDLYEELFAGKTGLSDMDKAKIIFNYITQNIRYSSVSFRQSGIIPQKAADVINTRLGDCKDVSTLFSSLARLAGLQNVHLVLVDTRDNGKLDLALPSIDFNHCIASFSVGKNTYYVDCTSEFTSMLSEGPYSINSFSLLINGDSASHEKPFYLNPSTRVKNCIVRNTDITIDENDQIKVVRNNLKVGNNAAYTRSIYKNIGKEQQEKEIKSSVSSEFDNIKLVKLTFDDNLKTVSDSVSYSYTYTAPDALQDVGDRFILKTPWSDKIESVEFLSEETRTYVLEFWRYTVTDIEDETIRFTIPKGKTLVKVPESVTINNEFFTYAMTYKLVGNVLTMNRKFTLKGYEISPDKYPVFKKDFEKMMKNDKQQIALK